MKIDWNGNVGSKIEVMAWAFFDFAVIGALLACILDLSRS